MMLFFLVKCGHIITCYQKKNILKNQSVTFTKKENIVMFCLKLSVYITKFILISAMAEQLNQKSYLKDCTGNSFFLMVSIEKIVESKCSCICVVTAFCVFMRFAQTCHIYYALHDMSPTQRPYTPFTY